MPRQPGVDFDPMPKPTGLPTTSWWVQKDRRAFREALETEGERMTHSPIGKLEGKPIRAMEP